MKKTQKLLAVLLGVCFAVCMGLGIISVSAEGTQPEKVENYTVAEETFDLTGGKADWIFAVYQKEYTAAPHSIGDYAGVRLTFSGSKTSMINQFLFQLGPDDRCVKVNKWSLTPADGKSVFYYPVSELDVNNADVATFKPDKVTCLLQTTNGTADDFCRVTLKVELLAREPVEDRVIADKTSVTIAGGSAPALAISGWDEQVGGVNKPGTLSGYKYTKLSVYPTENGELLTRAFVKFGDGGSGMIYQLKDISAPTGKLTVMYLDNSEYQIESGETNDFTVRFVQFVAYTSGSAEESFVGNIKIELVSEKEEVADDETAITYVAIDKTSAVMEVEEQLQLRATVEGGAQADKTVTWSTSEATVASVENGLVTALKPGNAVITITASDGKTATCTVTVKEPYSEPDLSELSDITVKEHTANVPGGHDGWYFYLNGKVDAKAPFYLSRYASARVTFEGEKANLIKQFLLQFGPDTNCFAKDVYGNLGLVSGKNEVVLDIASFSANGATADSFLFDDVKILLKTNGTEGEEFEIKCKIELILENEVKEDVKVFDFSYKGGALDYDETTGIYTEDRGSLTAQFTPDQGKDGSGACVITVLTDEVNGQVWLTTGGRWLDHKPSVSANNKLYFNNFGSIDISFYVKDAYYIENILVTMTPCDSTAQAIAGGKPYVSKAIGVIQNNGWQHLRFNIDSMTPQNEFDFDAKIEFVSIELVCTVRAGTPVGEKIIFDDFFLRTSKCNPSITEKEGFEKTYTTGTEVDFANAIETAHPFDDELNVSFGVKFSKTEDGEKQVVTVSGSTATLNKAGFYFVTATVMDSMGASAQTEFTVTATGEDIDVEAPSIIIPSSIPKLMTQAGEIDLTVIKVTDDVDANPTVTMKVTDEKGNEITIKDGKVTLDKNGKYTLTVTAKDAAGHEKTVTRTITVEGIKEPEASNQGGCGGAMGMGATSLIAVFGFAAVLLKRKQN